MCGADVGECHKNNRWQRRREQAVWRQFAPDSARATVYYPHGESGRVGILGANSTQAVGVLAFLLAFTFLPIGIMTSGAIYYLLAIALLVVSVIIFAKCKPLENQEN